MTLLLEAVAAAEGTVAAVEEVNGSAGSVTEMEHAVDRTAHERRLALGDVGWRPRMPCWDREYIDRWSLSLNFKIVLRTIPVVFRRTGAYWSFVLQFLLSPARLLSNICALELALFRRCHSNFVEWLGSEALISETWCA